MQLDCARTPAIAPRAVSNSSAAAGLALVENFMEASTAQNTEDPDERRVRQAAAGLLQVVPGLDL